MLIRSSVNPLAAALQLCLSRATQHAAVVAAGANERGTFSAHTAPGSTTPPSPSNQPQAISTSAWPLASGTITPRLPVQAPQLSWFATSASSAAAQRRGNKQQHASSRFRSPYAALERGMQQGRRNAERPEQDRGSFRSRSRSQHAARIGDTQLERRPHQHKHHGGDRSRHDRQPLQSGWAISDLSSSPSTSSSALVQQQRPPHPAHQLESANRHSSRPEAALPEGLGAATGQLTRLMPEGALMTLIKGTKRLEDLEGLLVEYGDQFRPLHVAAATAQLPKLEASATNRARRVQRMSELLASGLLATAGSLDARSIAQSLHALALVRHMPEQLLQALAGRLVAGGPRCSVHDMLPSEVAATAAALAVAQGLWAEQRAAGLVRQGAQSSTAGSSAAGSSRPLPRSAAAMLGTGVVDGTAPAAPAAAPAGSAAHDGAAASDGDDAQAAPSSVAMAAVAAGSGAGNMLARQAPLQELWRLLAATASNRLNSFGAPELAQLALALVRGRAADAALLDAIARSALLRTHTFSAGAVANMVAAFAAAGHAHAPLLDAMAAAFAASKADFRPGQIAALVRHYAALGHYSADLCLAACKMGSGKLRAFSPTDAVSLVTALGVLGHADEPLLKKLVAALPGAIESGRVSAGEGVEALWALLWLGHRQEAVEQLLGALNRQLQHHVQELAPPQLAKLLWCYALLEEADEQLLRPPLAALRGLKPTVFGQQDLVLLYQAHRLLTSGWLEEDAPQQAQDAAQHPLGTAESALDAAEQAPDAAEQMLERAWPKGLVKAAGVAAAAKARRRGDRCGRQRQDIADILEDAGLEVAVKLQLDGGALVPDVALLAGQLRVAVQCDDARRLTASTPHKPLGSTLAEDWVLEKMGWRVVHVPQHAWDMFRGLEDGKLAFVHNLFTAHKIPL